MAVVCVLTAVFPVLANLVDFSASFEARRTVVLL